MLRFLWTLLQLSLLLALIAWLGQFNAPVQISWNGFLIELSLLTLCIGGAAVFCAALIVVTLIGKARRIPKNLAEYRQKRRRESGYRALTRGMVAVAAGEKLVARKAARQAELLLQEPPLTMLLSAQSAQLEGDELAAKSYFQNMLDHPEMAFLGWRGLIMQALKQGKEQEARALMTQAEARFPKQPWLITQALELEERAGNSSKALALVHRAQKTGALTLSDAAEHEVSLLLQQGQDFFADGHAQEAKNSALKAGKILKKHENTRLGFRQMLLLADCAVQMSDDGEAEKALQQCWSYQIDNAAVLERLHILYQDKEPLQQWKATQGFFKDTELDTQAAVWLAGIALTAGLVGEAEAALKRDPEPDNLEHYQLREQITEQQESAL